MFYVNLSYGVVTALSVEANSGAKKMFSAMYNVIVTYLFSGRATKNVASSFNNLRKTSGKSKDAVATNQISDLAMLKKCPYFRLVMCDVIHYDLQKSFYTTF